MAEKPHYKFLLVDINQNFIPREWHHTTFTRSLTTTEAGIIYNITE